MHTIVLVLFLISALLAEPFASDTLLKKVDNKYGAFAKNRFIYMNKVLSQLQNKSDLEKLEGVNNFFNQVRYGSDLKVYGRRDYWATPWEFLGRDIGDCEDYVIAKYFALKQLEIDPTKLYFTYVKSTRLKQPHMVLTYFESPNAVPLVLDNTNFKIFPATKRKDLIPIYNFNGDVLYHGNTDAKKKNISKTHKKWDQLINNIARNKL